MQLGRKKSSKSFLFAPTSRMFKSKGRKASSNTLNYELREELEKLKALYDSTDNSTQQASTLLAEFTRNQVNLS